MDRCALFVDAGYLLADGAMAVHGTRHRETVSWDFGGILQLLGNLARERTGMPLLRCYWYEATVEGRRSPEHDSLADLPGLKLRLGRIRPGRREGVDSEIHRDLMTLARNGALTDAVLVSGDEDLAQVVADAQDLGVRITIVHVAVDGNWTISRVLRQECDDLIEIGSGHLRPYVNLLAGMDGTAGSSLGASPLSNGHGSNGHGGSLGALQPASHNGPPPASPLGGQPPATPAPAVRDLGAAMSGGNLNGPGTGTGPMPLPGAAGGGAGGSSYGTGERPLPPSYGTNERPVPPSYSTGERPAPSSYSTGERPAPSYGTGERPAPPSYGTGERPVPPSYSTGERPAPPSYGTGGQQVPMQAAPTSGPSSTQAPPAPSQPPSPQYTSSPVPSPSPPPPPQTMQPGQQNGPYTGPQQVSHVPAQQTPTLADAVKAAHQEGQDFGESVARDAPALWLEAVLARKPRMPSDLEARLLQGSSLPIDFLLHDEVRHALRRGFWDALERSRR